MHARPIFLVGLLIFAAMAAACGGGEEDSPGVAAPPTASLETCTGFLDLAELQKAAGRSDVAIAEPNVNSGLQEPHAPGLLAMCVIAYVTPEIQTGEPSQLRISGPSMTQTVIEFDLTETADTHQNFVLENTLLTGGGGTPDSQVAEGVLDDRSYLWTMNEDRVGSILGFILGTYIVQLHTTLPEGSTPLVASQDLTALAEMVRASLPPLG